MSDQPITVQEFRASIVHSRGGEAAFGPEQLRILEAYVHALAVKPSEMDAGVIERLAALLPPKVANRGVGHTDLSKLSDSELAAFEAMLEKAAVPGPAPEPGSDKATIAELLRMVDFWRANCAEAQRLQGIAEQAEQVAKRLENDAYMANLELREENARLQERLATVAATAAGVAKDPAAPETQPATAPLTGKWHPDSRPSNVVDITNAPNFGPRNAALFDTSDPSGRGRGLP